MCFFLCVRDAQDQVLTGRVSFSEAAIVVQLQRAMSLHPSDLFPSSSRLADPHWLYFMHRIYSSIVLSVIQRTERHLVQTVTFTVKARTPGRSRRG